MGQTFRSIADEVLETAGIVARCSLCATESRVYPFPSDIDDPDVPADYVDEACAACIRRVRFDFWDEKSTRGRIQAMINSHFPKGTLSGAERQRRLESILSEYQRTPRLPTFIQHDDWPHCCGDFTEYLGEPTSLSGGDLDHYQYWEKCPCENPTGDRIYDLIPNSRLAVLGGVSGFRCNECGRHFWTFQCT